MPHMTGAHPGTAVKGTIYPNSEARLPLLPASTTVALVLLRRAENEMPSTHKVVISAPANAAAGRNLK